MSLTLQLDAELESQVRSLAAQKGVAPEHWLLEEIRSRFKVNKETALLQQILRGQTETFWTHYWSLVAKRQASEITPAELEELTALSDQLEMQNVDRIKALVELAALRGQDVRSLRIELGLEPVAAA